MDKNPLLRDSLGDNNLKQRIEQIQTKVTPLLSRTTNVNIDYTEHTVEHSLHIEEIYVACFNEIIAILNDDEKFLLISATLIHDIGMVGQSKYQDEKDYAAEVRDSHQYRSAEFIQEYREELTLDHREADAITLIVEGHRVRDLESIAEKEPYNVGTFIRLRLLAALLRMGDELDILEERAPELVKKYLDVNSESLIHHERHEICTGIARDPETNIIYIKANIPNVKLERAVIELFNGIKAKYNEVKPILQKNEVHISNIEIILNTEQVVSQEICLYLACKGSVNQQELSNELISLNSRSQIEISESLKKLISKKIITKDIEGNYSLSTKEKHFILLLNTFLRTEFELQFTKSTFVQNYLNENFAIYVNSQFGVAYLDGDKEDRISILTHFPTSLEYFFDSRNTPYEFGNFDRRVTLDLGLMHALSVDVLKYPQELEGEIHLAAQAISRTLSDAIFPFLKISASLPNAAKKKEKMIELFKQGINPFDKGVNEADGGKFTVTSTLTKNQLPNLDFMTLMLASEITGVPVEFSKDIAMKDIKFDRDDGFQKNLENNNFVSMKVIPNIEYNHFNLSALIDFDYNFSKRELTIRLQKDMANLDQNPYELNIFSDGNDITLNLNCNMCGKISEIIKFDSLMKDWQENGLRRFIIYSGKDEQEPFRMVPPNIKWETGKFINKFKKILDVLQIDTNDVPYLLKPEIIKRIENLKDNEINVKSCNSIIEDIKKAVPKNITKVFLHVIDKQNNTLNTKGLGILPYWFNLHSLNLKPYNKSNKSIIKDIYERKHSLNLRKYCYEYNEQELFDYIVNVFDSKKSSPIETVLDHILKDKGTIVKFIIQIDFLKVEESFWQEEQTIQIIITKDDLEISKFNTLNHLLVEEDFLNAIPLMEELNRDEYLENLAFAYCMKEDYPKSIEIANSAIQRNYRSVAHFTKGLALVLSNKPEEGFIAYMNGCFLVDNKIWDPIASNNLIEFLEQKGIEINKEITKVIDRMGYYSKIHGKKFNKRCFCGSKEHYSSCHGREFLI